MINFGAVFIAVSVSFLGILIFSKSEISGPEFFSMVTSFALVTAAFSAHSVWKKTEHWKVKKDAFSFLISHKSKLNKFQTKVVKCRQRFKGYEKSPATQLGPDSPKEVLEKLSKDVEGIIQSQLAIVDLHYLTNTLHNHLISTDLNWSRAFTEELYIKMANNFRELSGYYKRSPNCFDELLTHLRHITYYCSDLPDEDDDFFIGLSKDIDPTFVNVQRKLNEFEIQIDQTIDAIESKLKSSF